MATVRVKPDVACVVFHNGEHIALAPNLPPFDANDPLVRAFPDMFCVDSAIPAPKRVDSVAAGYIEQATAAPGERRNR